MKVYPPCTGCRTAMVSSASPVPEGMSRYGGDGLCNRCHQRRGREAASWGDYSSRTYKPEPWTADALCAKGDPEIFYPTPGQTAVTRLAKRLCSTCPVAAECLTSALDRDEPFGVWGGLTSAERYDLKHGRRGRVS